MSEDKKIAATILLTASEMVTKERVGHGDTEPSFQMIADLWNVYVKHTIMTRQSGIGVNITPYDVAQMMSLLKKARATYGDQTNVDNYTDDVGYTALAGMLRTPALKNAVGQKKTYEPGYFENSPEIRSKPGNAVGHSNLGGGADGGYI